MLLRLWAIQFVHTYDIIGQDSCTDLTQGEQTSFTIWNHRRALCVSVCVKSIGTVSIYIKALQSQHFRLRKISASQFQFQLRKAPIIFLIALQGGQLKECPDIYQYRRNECFRCPWYQENIASIHRLMNIWRREHMWARKETLQIYFLWLWHSISTELESELESGFGV